MKIKRLLAGVIASAMAISAMAISASAEEVSYGPYNVLGVYIKTAGEYEDMDATELEAEGITLTIDEVKVDGEVQSEKDALVYMQDNELKAELFNQYNDKAPNKLAVYPDYRLDITFTVKGVTGDAYLGGGISEGGAEWSYTFWGKDGEISEGLESVDTTVDADGTFTVSVIFDEEPAEAPADDADDADDADEDEKPADNPTTGMPIAGAGLVVLATASLAAATIIKKK